MPQPEDAQSSLMLRLFGPYTVRVDGRPLMRLRSSKGQWLLALLVLRQDRDVDRAWLAGSLWPESSESQARDYLRHSLTDLRRALGSQAYRLGSPTPRTLRLDLSGVTVDVISFDEAVTFTDRASLERAVALYRGPLLEGCAEEWVLTEREGREQAYLSALEMLSDQAITRGEPGVAVSCLRQIVMVAPLQEKAQRALMQVLAADRDYSAAVQVYRDLRLLLHDELHSEPDPETTALWQQIRNEARHRARNLVAAPNPTPPSPSRLSQPLTTLPVGTVTFLLTDIEGSTRLWEAHPQAMRQTLTRHDALAEAIIAQHHGHWLKSRGEGDSLFAVFDRPGDALAGACALQQAFQEEDWPEGTPLRVRMALHTGEVDLRDGDYYGPVVNRCARLRAIGQGGQVLLSQATQELVRDGLLEGCSLKDLGMHRLRDLSRPEPVFQLLHPDLSTDFLPLISLNDLSTNLPIQPTSFIGREKEMAKVKTLLSRTHLLTLIGSGGCGKTRLCLQMAADVLEEFPDGVWLVELASLSDTALVVQTVANMLGVRETPGQSLLQTLTTALKTGHLMLVLDNCEHLLAACAELADALLIACPNVKILATSREGMNIAGESLYRIPSLSLPDTEQTLTPESLRQSEATHLFIERAMTVRSDFAVTEANASILATVCQYLDGIPLAIELAAARMRALPLEQLASRLKDCIHILTGGSRSALPRHQTLRAAIDWSYNLLDEQERLLLNRLSVFAGGWTLDAAEFLCGADEGIGYQASGVVLEGKGGAESLLYATPDTRRLHEALDLLTSLVDKSLVVYEESSVGGRYRLLETVKQFGLEQLHASGEHAAARRRHLDFYLRLAEQAEPKLSGPEQEAWIKRLNMELDNLRAAWEWCSEAEETEAGLRLTGALWRFWWLMNFYVEGSAWQERVLKDRRGWSVSSRAQALAAAALLAHHRTDQQRAASLAEESLALYRQLGDSRGIGFALAVLGWAAACQGDLDRADGCFAASLTLARDAGDTWLIAYTLIGSGVEAAMQRGHAEALAVLEEALTYCREVGDPYLIVYASLNLGLQRYYTNDIAQARTLMEEVIQLSLPARHQRRIAGALEASAYLAVAQEQHERGTCLLGAAEVLREITGAPLFPHWEAAHERNVAMTQDTLGAEPFAMAWAAGRSLRMEQAVAMALAPIPPAECSD